MNVSAGILKDFNKSRSYNTIESHCYLNSMGNYQKWLLFGFKVYYLENGVHGDREWTVARILRDFKDVYSPSVDVLQLLL